MRSVLTLVLLIALAGVMLASNPTPKQYQLWLGQHIAQSAQQNGSAPWIGQLFGSIGSALSSLVTERQNYGVLSVYITHDPTKSDRCTHVVGLASRFVVADALLGTTCPKSVSERVGTLSS